VFSPCFCGGVDFTVTVWALGGVAEKPGPNGAAEKPADWRRESVRARGPAGRSPAVLLLIMLPLPPRNAANGPSKRDDQPATPTNQPTHVLEAGPEHARQHPKYPPSIAKAGKGSHCWPPWKSPETPAKHLKR